MNENLKEEDVNERDIDGNGLEEGELYAFKKGVLEHIQRDPEDNLRKIRITHEAFEAAVTVQRNMRKVLDGYKPDITVVISALIEEAAQDLEKATSSIKKYGQKMFA